MAIVQFLLLIFFGGWFIANGLGAKDSFAVSLVIFAQIVVGLPLTLAFLRLNFTLIGLLGASFAVGAIEFTVADQVAANLGIPLVLAMGLLPLPFFIPSIRAQFRSIPVSTEIDYRLLITLPLIVVSGSGVFPGGWTVTICATGIVLCSTYLPIVKRARFGMQVVTTLGLIFWSMSLMAIRPSHQPYGSFVLRPLYTGTDDQIFSESLGWSLSHFGLGEYPAAIGTSVRYHWFSIAWSGMMEKVSGAAPLVTTLHVAKAVGFVFTALVAFESLLILTRSLRSSFFALYILFGTSTALSPGRFVYVVNTSNVVPFIWFSLLFLSLVAHVKKSLKFPELVIPLLLCVILISKAPFGVCALFGTIVALFVMYRRSRLKQSLLLMVLSVSAPVAAYVMFLTPHQWEQRKFSIDWNFGGIGRGSSFFPFISIVFILILCITTSIGLLPLIGRRVSKDQSVLLWFLVATSAVGLLRFVIAGGSAELYFFNATIFALSLSVALGVQHFLDDLDFRKVVTLSVIAFGSFSLTTIELKSVILDRSYLNLALQISIPFILCVVLSIPFLIFQNGRLSRLGVAWSSVAVITAVFSLTAIFVRTVQQPPDFSFAADIASTSEIDALDWLRTNSPDQAIIATNRTLCRRDEDCDIDESRFLISAFGKRRVLIEGPRFVVGGRPYPTWVDERISASLNFTELPSLSNARILKHFGVEWFYLLKQDNFSAIKRQALARVGAIRYENTSVLILQFKQDNS